MFLSFVALGPDAGIDADKLRSALRADPSLATAEVEWDAERTTLTVTVGDDSVILTPVAAPIPGFVDDCGRAPLWPDGADPAHASHVILTALSDGPPLAQAVLLTRVTELLVRTCGQPVGAMWGASGVIVPPDVFSEMAAVLAEGRPIAALWVACRVEPVGEGRASGRTEGLGSFGLLEIEALDVPEPPSELRDRLLGVAVYLLSRGPVLQDGDTIGESEDERIRVVVAGRPSGDRPDQEEEVMRLEYDEGEDDLDEEGADDLDEDVADAPTYDAPLRPRLAALLAAAGQPGEPPDAPQPGTPGEPPGPTPALPPDIPPPPAPPGPDAPLPEVPAPGAPPRPDAPQPEIPPPDVPPHAPPGFPPPSEPPPDVPVPDVPTPDAPLPEVPPPDAPLPGPRIPDVPPPTPGPPGSPYMTASSATASDPAKKPWWKFW